MAEDFIIKKLEGAACDQVSAFKLRDPTHKRLQVYIRSKALKASNANITKTYVAKLSDSNRVVGYVTIMCAEIELNKFYQIEDKPDANRFKFQPAVRIACLATDDGHRGKRIGRELLALVYGLVKKDIASIVGCRFIVLDAKAASIPFYQKNGFRLLDTDDNRNREHPVMFIDVRDL